MYCFCVHVHHVTTVLGCLKPFIDLHSKWQALHIPTGLPGVTSFTYFISLLLCWFILHDSQPPIVPKLSSDGDISNFETYPEGELDKTPSVSDEDLETFKNFWGWELMSAR